MLHRGEVPSKGLAFLRDILSGEVQLEHSTEENTYMTSSEDNRVSIPPKRSGIGLSDDRSFISELPFDTVVLCRFFCWKLATVHKS